MPVTVGHDDDDDNDDDDDEDDDDDVTSLFLNGTEMVRCSHNDNARV